LHICNFCSTFAPQNENQRSVKTQIMARGNVTPDSFYAASRLEGEEQLLTWAQQALADGADILDIGACSTRPGSTPVSEEEEWRRLEPALAVLRKSFPDARLSLDTFRPEIARKALETFGPMIVNDISGGCDAMFDLVRKWKVPYIWTLRGDLDLPAQRPEMNDMDLILDPGFGFIGSTEKDYECLRRMDVLRAYGRPVLVGVSRKSMVYRPLGLTPDTCLAPTQALHMYALEHGATILRVHDVHAAKQIVTIYEHLHQ
jgi:dihydropteroate synthase